VGLMRKAFFPKDGPLTDAGGEGGEQQATADLFRRRDEHVQESREPPDRAVRRPMEAAEVNQLADVLLRVVHRAQRWLDESG
jgi:hypothetical protein